MITSQDIITFWFEELTPKQWFATNPELDQMIQKRFKEVHRMAAFGELSYWRETSLGRLSEIIILDQFSRNIYRGKSEAFAQDSMALVLSQEMITHGFDKNLSLPMKAFAYMPFMHSESPVIHEKAIELFATPGLENNYKFEKLHKDIIDRFGRYPHRNKILGRNSTSEELEFLKTHPGF